MLVECSNCLVYCAPTRKSVEPLHRLTAAERISGLLPPNEASEASMLRFASPSVIHIVPRAPSLYLSASIMYATCGDHTQAVGI